MKPFQPAKMQTPPVREFLRDMRRHGVTRAIAKDLYRRMKTDACWLNDVYQVNVSQLDDGLTHLSIKRIDRAPVHDWRDLQAIKNALCGAEREAVEIYPSESRKVDTANQYHLWVFPAGFAFPIGFNMRAVTDEPGMNAVQRPGAAVSPIETPPASLAAGLPEAVELLREALAYRADHFDNDSDIETQVGGADLVDYFHGWRREVLAQFPDLKAPAQVWCSVCGDDHSPPECNDEFPEPGQIRETGR